MRDEGKYTIIQKRRKDNVDKYSKAEKMKE